MKLEYKSLLAYKTWSFTTLIAHKKCVVWKWVFKIKENPDGSVNQYKSHLVAKCFHQQPDFDYNETLYPIVKPTTIRVMLTLAITHKWEIQQVDITNAFLNDTL